MSRRSIGFAIAGVTILAPCIAWEVASPWWTLKNMQDAARARDSERLASYVDFPRVRANLREQLIQRAEKNGPAPAYESFVRRYGVDLMMDPIIKVIISPEALRVALEVAPNSSGSSSSTAKPACGMKREGLEHFRVRCAQLPNGLADLEFERHGFGWRLVGIDLPDDYGAAVS